MASHNNIPFRQHGSQFQSHLDPHRVPQFDILGWYPKYLSCHQYFLNHAQHTMPLQMLAALINIQLPCQKQPLPPVQGSSASSSSAGPDSRYLRPPYDPRRFTAPQNYVPPPPAKHICLLPYIRRLIATGYDTPGILHGFFGDNWQAGISPLYEAERRNFMFAAQSSNWLGVKQACDSGPEVPVLYLSPPKDVSEEDIQTAEIEWSQWLDMEAWAVGPRSRASPENDGSGKGKGKEKEVQTEIYH